MDNLMRTTEDMNRPEKGLGFESASVCINGTPNSVAWIVSEIPAAQLCRSGTGDGAPAPSPS